MSDFGDKLLMFGVVLAICAVAARLGDIVARLDQIAVVMGVGK